MLDATQARAVALDLLARKPWTRRDLGERLRRRGAPADIVAPLLTDLEARGYLDDAQFARAWVESRSRSRGAGPGRLQAELRARGVAAGLIEAAIQETFGDPATVAASALAVAKKRLEILRTRRPERVAARLRDYLLRRGYAAGVVASVVRTLCGPAGEELADGEP